MFSSILQRVVLAGALVSSAALVLPSSSGAARAADVPTVRVGLICGGMTPMIAQVPMNDGSFERAGIHVEKLCFAGGPPAVQALLGKSIDAYIGSYDHTLRQRARGFDIKAYAEIYNGYSYEVIAKTSSPLKSLADAKGMTFGITAPGALSDDALRLGLTAAGLNPERDVSIIGAGSGAPMIAALETNRIAGATLAEPLITSLTADGKYKVIYNPTEPFAGNVIMASAAWVAVNRPAFATMLRVMKAAQVRIEKNPSSAIPPMQKDFANVGPRIMLQAIQQQLKHVPKGLLVDRASTDPVVAATLKKGDIKVAIPFTEAVDNSIVAGK